MRHLPSLAKVMCLRYVNANMAWQLGHDEEALRKLAQHADILGLTECRTRDNKPLDVAEILGPEWRVFQTMRDEKGRLSAAHAGTVCAVRKGIKVRRSTLLPLSPKGHKVQARYQRVTVIVDRGVVDVIVGHNPLPTTGQQRTAARNASTAIGRAKRRRANNPRRRWIWMGDCNMDPKVWARAMGAPFFFGDRPMCTLWSAGWGNVRRVKFKVKGLDHWVLGLQRAA